MKPPMHDLVTLMRPKLIKDVHTVQSGDTLNGIALKYDVTSQAIMTENNMPSTSIYVGQKLTIPNPHIEKDDHGFPITEEIQVMARVVEESTVVIDAQGQEKQATFTVMFPPTITPGLGDQIKVQDQTVAILKRKPRKSYSGQKIYYWVTNCGT